MQAYKENFIAEKNSVIRQAKQMWAERCAEYVKNYGDRGTCVLGAGIEIDFIPPRCRTPRRMMLISASSVCNAQGSIVWEDSKDEIINFLRENGIECRYAWGNMD